MAKVTNVNLAPTTGSEAMFDLMVFLRDQMLFVITISGDGLAAFNGAGASVITVAGAGANGMANTDAHFTAQDPAGAYEWCFHRGATDVIWEIVISSLDGFTGGSATVRPTATDEQILRDTTMFSTNNTYRWHLVGNTTPIGGAVVVYPWAAFATDNVSGGDGRTFISHEPMEPGSYPELTGTRAVPITGEPDPCIYIADFNNTIESQWRFQNSAKYWNYPENSPAKGYFCMNGVNGNSESFLFYSGAIITSGASANEFHYPADSTAGDGVGVDPRDGSDPFSRLFITRPSKFAFWPGPKGFCATIRITGVDRGYPNTLDIGGERYVYMHQLLMPFENGTTPL